MFNSLEKLLALETWMTKSLANETEATGNSARPKLKMPVRAEIASYLPIPSLFLFSKRTCPLPPLCCLLKPQQPSWDGATS